MKWRFPTKTVKRTFVYTITSETFIQGLVTGAIVGVITAFIEGFGKYGSMGIYSLTGLFVPTKIVMGFMMMGLAFFALWIESNTEEWREMVEKTTGEEPSDDTLDGE